jgi:hypothetical protein
VHPVLQTGRFDALPNTNDNVFSWRREKDKNDFAWVVVNLSDRPQNTTIDLLFPPDMQQVSGTANAHRSGNKFIIDLPPYGAGVWISK